MLTVPQIEQSVLTISLKYMQNKIWKINKWGGGPTKNPKTNKQGGTIIWNWRVLCGYLDA